MNNVFIIIIKELTDNIFNNYEDTNGFSFFSEKGIVGDVEGISKFDDIVSDEDGMMIHDYFPGYLKITYSIKTPVEDLKKSIEQYGFWYGNDFPKVHTALPVDTRPLMKFIFNSERPFFALWAIDSLSQGFDKFPYVNSSLIEMFSALKLLKLFKKTIVLIVGYKTEKTPFIYVSPDTYSSDTNKTFMKRNIGKIEKQQLFDILKGEPIE